MRYTFLTIFVILSFVIADAWALQIIDGTEHDERAHITPQITDMFIKNFINEKIKAPNTTYLNKKGGTSTLRDLKGKLIVMSFWPKWCMSCSTEIKLMNKLAKSFIENERDDVLFMAVIIDYTNFEDAKSMVNEYGIDALELGFDQKRNLMGNLGALSIPTSIIISKSSNVIMRFNNHINWEDPAVKGNILSLTKY